MVTQQLGNRVAAKFGGKLVEIIPWVPSEVRNALPMAACPYCDAKATDPCKVKRGTIRDPHAARWEQFHEGITAATVAAEESQ
jgi:hypothetical protein